MNNKGNINNLFPAILAIILVGALLCVGILILTSFQNTTYLNTAVTVVNESLAKPTYAGITLATGAATRNGVCGALTQVMNGTGATSVKIPLGNFTQTGCIVQNATDDVFSTNMLYSYPYTYDAATATTNAIGSTNTSLLSLAVTWMPIIIVVIAAGIVLSILLGAFAGKRK